VADKSTEARTRRMRPGKKRRLGMRKWRAAAEEVRQKRTQRNRDKKVRKKAREQARKLLLLENDDNEGEDASKGERGS
jgi:hypothetical protein